MMWAYEMFDTWTVHESTAHTTRVTITKEMLAMEDHQIAAITQLLGAEADRLEAMAVEEEEHSATLFIKSAQLSDEARVHRDQARMLQGAAKVIAREPITA